MKYPLHLPSALKKDINLHQDNLQATLQKIFFKDKISPGHPWWGPTIKQHLQEISRNIFISLK